MKKIRDLAELFAVFFKIGAITFGGGLAMLPNLEHELTVKRNWTSRDQLLDYFAIGQATPGIIAVNVATFVGYTRAGILGGCIATLGVVTPSVLIISLIALVFQSITGIALVQTALAGMNLAVAAMLCQITWKLHSKVLASVLGIILFLIAFLGIVVFHVPTAIVIIATIITGIIIHMIKGKK
ncbi:MAG: chromate transporter [Treponemataceae bacterium]|nr:chromate transporter [Treponemataceae bacterium]